MAKIENGWFYEFIDAYHGQAMSLEVEEILCQHKSKYQDILIFKSKANGNVLVLDGCIQLTDKDECSYQEMITFLALNSHPNPNKVLVIGAGDGGVIREIAKHHLVESIVQCELDEDIVKLSKTYFPNMSCGYASPKHKLHFGCGKEFMRQIQGEFDVIITDSSDSSGPGAALFQKEYYELIRSALNPGGIFCNEGECPWLDNQFVKSRLEFCRSIFPVVKFAIVNVPTYPCGQIGFLICSRNSATIFEEPVTKFTQEQLSSLNLQFYNSDVHTAAFAIPQFFEKITEDYDGSCYTKNNSWFWAKPEEAPGQSFGLIKEEIVFSEKGQQDILVFKNYIYGNVLVIDGIIQYTEKDQFVYEECIAHLSLNSHPHPKKVLIIGALSGGIIQEVSRHESVEAVVQIEMNATAIEVSKQYFPRASAGYSSSKLEYLHIGDPLLYLKQHRCEFDVIITVPTQILLNQDTSELLKNALKPNGISISKVPSFWFQLDSIHKLVRHDRTRFSIIKLAYVCLPTSPNGQTTFVLRSLNPDTYFGTPNHQLSDHHLSQLEFYNSKVHKASFALPEFVKRVVES